MRALSWLVVALLWGLAQAPSARAFEDTITLGLGGGYSVLPGAAQAHGINADALLGYGLSEALLLRGVLGYPVLPADEAPLHLIAPRVELLYVIDVVDVVPMFGLGAGAVARVSSDRSTLDPAVHLAAGAAYWLSFDWLVALDVRAHVLPTELAREPLWITATLSLVLALDS